jgi:hypothetical protein
MSDMTSSIIQRRLNTGQSFKETAIEIVDDVTLGENNFHADVDASGGVVTVTFEPAPKHGQRHSVAKADSSGNAVTVDGNGFLINGSATDTLAGQYNVRSYIFLGGSQEWRKLLLS